MADFQNLQYRLEGQSCPATSSLEELWDHIKATILQPLEVLVYNMKKHKDWFDENNSKIQEMLAKRSVYHAHLAQMSCKWKKTAFYPECSKLQHMLWDIQNEWKSNLTEKIQFCTDTSDQRVFYEPLKMAYSLPTRLKASYRVFWTSGQSFTALFSTWYTVQENVINKIPQQPMKIELDVPPTLDGTINIHRATKEWKSCWNQQHLTSDLVNWGLHNTDIITLYKKRKNVWLFKLSQYNPTFHSWQNSGKGTIEQIGTHHWRRIPPWEPVWL